MCGFCGFSAGAAETQTEVGDRDRRRRGDLATAESRLAAWWKATSETGTLWGGTIVVVPGINIILLIESKEAR